MILRLTCSRPPMRSSRILNPLSPSSSNENGADNFAEMGLGRQAVNSEVDPERFSRSGRKQSDHFELRVSDLNERAIVFTPVQGRPEASRSTGGPSPGIAFECCSNPAILILPHGCNVGAHSEQRPLLYDHLVIQQAGSIGRQFGLPVGCLLR